MMLMAWTSATNCARIFNASMTEDVFPAVQSLRDLRSSLRWLYNSIPS